MYGLDLISKTASGGARRYYAQDGLGTTVALSNTSGTSVGTASYYAYGEQRTATGESAAPFEFAGEQRDASTGLYYLRARYYDPDAGRFITKDPWGGSTMAPGTLNGYPYVLGNPVSGTDPSGLCVAAWMDCPEAIRRGVDGIRRAYESTSDQVRDAVERVTDSKVATAVWNGFGPPYSLTKLASIADLVPLAEACGAVTAGAAYVPCAGIEAAIGNVAFALTQNQIAQSGCGTANQTAATAANVASWRADIRQLVFGEIAEFVEYLAGNIALDCSSRFGNSDLGNHDS